MMPQESVADGPFRLAALLYVDAGWGVFPLPAGRKEPPPDGWTGASAPYASRADVEEWLRIGTARCNIALRMPPDVVGLDVDNWGTKRGGATWHDLIKKFGPLPGTWSSSAREGGISGIRFYRVPAGLAWPSHAGTDIDVIQQRHRYAVVWPSVHPGNYPGDPAQGSVYTWTRPDGLRVVGADVPRVDELPELPDAWVVGLTGGRVADDPTVRAGVGVAAARAWLERHDPTGMPCPAMLRAAQGGAGAILARTPTRHDAALAGLHAVVMLAAEGHYGVHAAHTLIAQAWAQAVGDASRDGEFARLADGAVQVAMARPERSAELGDPCDDPFGSYVPPMPGPGASVPPAPTPGPAADPGVGVPVTGASDGSPATDPGEQLIEFLAAQEIVKMRARELARQRLRAEQRADVPDVVGLGALVDEPDTPVLWRIGSGAEDHNLLPCEGNAVLAAQRKAGKTTLMANLVRCLADGGMFLGWFPVLPVDGRVVLVDLEMGRTMLKRWYRRLGVKARDKVSVYTMRGRASAFDLTDPVVRGEWAARLRADGCTLLVIDPLAPVLDSCGLDENHDVGRFLVAIDALKDEAGIAECIVVHHAGHNGERARGHSRLRDWPDAEWRIVRELPPTPGAEPPPDARRFFAAEGREVALSEIQLTYDPLTGFLGVGEGNRLDAKKARQADDMLGDIVDFLAGCDGPKTVVEIRVALRKNNQAVRDACRDGARRGLLKAMPTGHGGALYGLPDEQKWS